MGKGRNDGILYSGQTAKPQAAAMLERREARTQEKEQQRTALMPAAQLILGEIERERSKISQKVLDYVTAGEADENIKAELLGMKHYEASLSKFKARIENILRPRPISPSQRRRVASMTVQEGMEAGL